MGKKKEITQSLRNQAVGLFKGNHKYRQISSLLSIPLSTTHSIISHWKKFGTTKNLPRSGRPRKLQRDIRVVKRIVKKNRFSTLKVLSNHVKGSNIDISKRTLRRTLKTIGFKSCMRANKPLISEKNRKKRLSFTIIIRNSPSMIGPVLFGPTNQDLSFSIQTEGFEFGGKVTKDSIQTALLELYRGTVALF